MPSPIEILKQVEEIAARIEAVAKDFDSGADLFAKVDPYRLAELLDLQPEEFESRTKCSHRVSLDEYGDPIYYYLDPLKGKVPAERVQELTKRSESFEAGEV